MISLYLGPQCFCSTILRDVIFMEACSTSIISTTCILQHAVVCWVTAHIVYFIQLNRTSASILWSPRRRHRLALAPNGVNQRRVGLHQQTTPPSSTYDFTDIKIYTASSQTSPTRTTTLSYMITLSYLLRVLHHQQKSSPRSIPTWSSAAADKTLPPPQNRCRRRLKPCRRHRTLPPPQTPAAAA
jgi:hypothetical protein